MGSDGQLLRRLGKAARQFSLVSLMIGVEATVALEVIFMIANIQTLGVPIRYASIPGTVSAVIGIFLIPTLGFIMGNSGKSKRGKAIILIFTSSFLILGNFMIFLANTIKLVHFDDGLNESNQSVLFNTSTTSNVSSNSTSSITPPEIVNLIEVSNVSTVSPITGEEPIHYYAIFAMIGYLLIDCGYDSSNCFLKTFALTSIEPDGHSSIIVKSILVSSIGGCVTAILGSIGLGNRLTAGTNHDSNAAQCAFVAAMCFVFVVSGLITTLSTGFCCPPYTGTVEKIADTSDTTPFSADERSPIVRSGSESRGLTSSHLPSNSHQRHTSENPKSESKNNDSDTSNILYQRDSISKKGIKGFLIRQKKQILINTTTFFMLGAIYSFEVYVGNFVGEGIFHGDPQAPTNSQEYERYLEGIKQGSLGTLIYYISFSVLNAFQEILLVKFGWKIEIIVTSSVHVVVNLICALTATLWSFYVAAVWTGIFRTVAVTVPYILANEFAKKQNEGGDSSLSIAIVAAMLPCAFTICSALMGPLIDATGNVATPIYYTATCAFLGLVTIIFLKDD